MRPNRDAAGRRRAAEALRASEGRWYAIFENSAVGIALADRQGKFIATNRAYREMVGYTDEELREMSFMDLTHEEDRPANAALVQELWDGMRQQYQIEKRYWRKDGRLIWVRQTVSRAPGAGTAPPFAMAIMEDITERKHAEEALRESQMRLELSLKASNTGLWDWNLRTDEMYVSPEGKSQLGYADYEIANRTEEWMILIHPEDRERVLATIRAFLDNPGPGYETECRLRHKDGSYRWILSRSSVLQDAGGKPFRMLGSYVDITERKRAEERLREYEKVVENLHEMIMVVDREYRYLIANRAFLNYRGMERDQVVGHLVPELLDKEVFDKVVKQKVDECLQGHVVHYELRYNYPRFGERDVFISYFPIQGPTSVDRVACVLEDITERKRAERELQRSLAQLRKLAARLETVREEERTRAAREIHDELGQALTAIKLDLTALLRDLPPDQGPAAQRRQSILKLLDEAMRSTRKIATELRPAVLDDLGLAAAVEWAAEDFQVRTGIQCQVSLPEVDISVDSERATALFRILQESLTNVARHSNATKVNVRLEKRNGGFLLEVHDNGRGIDQNLLSTTNSLGILGMRERALLLGGEFTIGGAPGEGTTVRVRIPEAWRAIAETTK
jgi:PAS domain S-box-containing protein